MAHEYRLTPLRRMLNRVMTAALKAGFGPPGIYLLTVVGRSSGIPRTTPVSLVVNADGRWLVSPYGDVNWARNARAAGQVTLRRSRRTETVPVTEIDDPDAMAPILKTYLKANRLAVGAYFDARPDAALDEFAAEAAHHPVFKIG